MLLKSGGTSGSQYSLDKMESTWAVQAAWLSGTIKVQADELAAKILENQPDAVPSSGEVEFVWSRMVLREYANKVLGSKIWESSPNYIFAEACELAKEAGVSPGSLLMPNDLGKQKPYILKIDKYSTGGIHDGHIRSLSKI